MKVFDLLSKSEQPLNLYEISRETNADIVLTGERNERSLSQSSFFNRPLDEILVVRGYAGRDCREYVRCYEYYTGIGQSWSASRR